MRQFNEVKKPDPKMAKSASKKELKKVLKEAVKNIAAKSSQRGQSTLFIQWFLVTALFFALQSTEVRISFITFN